MQAEDDRKEPIPRVIPDGGEAPPPEAVGGQGETPGQDPTEAREEDKRPTPVRMVMEGVEEDEQAGSKDARTFEDEPTGLDWVAVVTGRSSSGILPLRMVPLLELTFAHADDPSRPLRQALGYGTDLEGISDQELLGLFQRSEPFREPIQESESSDRKGRKGKNKRGSRD